MELFEDVKIKKIKGKKVGKDDIVDLINDNDRTHVINIIVMKFMKINKLSWEEIKEMILKIDETKVTANVFLGLLELKLTKIEK